MTQHQFIFPDISELMIQNYSSREEVQTSRVVCVDTETTRPGLKTAHHCTEDGPLAKASTVKESSSLVSLKELARVLGKSESSIRYHVRMGRIVPSGKLGKIYAFDPQEVLKRLKQQCSC